ncbi:MAG: hypothetical protein FJW39_07010 [Acidobacteria bacterium]|nr:hypothetical protein [Acidobacteriota bacterium]
MTFRTLTCTALAAAVLAPGDLYSQNLAANPEMHAGPGQWDYFYLNKIQAGPSYGPTGSWDSSRQTAYLPTYGHVSQHGSSWYGRMVVLFRSAPMRSTLGLPTTFNATYFDGVSNTPSTSAVFSMPPSLPTPSNPSWTPGPWQTNVWVPTVNTLSRLAFHNPLYDQALMIDSVYAFPAGTATAGKAAGMTALDEGHLTSPAGATPAALQGGLNGSAGVSFTKSLVIAANRANAGSPVRFQFEAAAARSGTAGFAVYDFANRTWVTLANGMGFGPMHGVSTAYGSPIVTPIFPGTLANYIHPASGLVLVSIWFSDGPTCISCAPPPSPAAMSVRNFQIF